MGLFKKQQMPPIGQKYELAKQQVANDIRIINDCFDILRTTTNPSTFNSRNQLLTEKINHLKQIGQQVNLPYSSIIEMENQQRQLLANPGIVYFDTLEKLEVQWSVISNMKQYNHPLTKEFESTCKLNIAQFYEYMEYEFKQGIEPPKHVPAFVRLAMLYDKQGEYEKAINTCVAAIKAGAIEDGTKGKMYGRLARMIKKSGIEVSDDILKLTMG